MTRYIIMLASLFVGLTLNSCIYVLPDLISRGERIDPKYLSQIQQVGKLVYLINNDIYITDLATKETKQLTSDKREKKMYSLNYALNKIVYSDNYTPIVISAITGEVLAKHTKYDYMNGLGWTGDDVLYVSHRRYPYPNNVIYIGGTGPTLKPYEGRDNLKSTTIGKNNEVAYISQGSTYSGGNHTRYTEVTVRYPGTKEDKYAKLIMDDHEDPTHTTFSVDSKTFQFLLEDWSNKYIGFYDIENNIASYTDRYDKKGYVFYTPDQKNKIECLSPYSYGGYNLYLNHLPDPKYNFYISTHENLDGGFAFDYKY